MPEGNAEKPDALVALSPPFQPLLFFKDFPASLSLDVRPSFNKFHSSLMAMCHPFGAMPLGSETANQL
jgi:hypothetical protein